LAAGLAVAAGSFDRSRTRTTAIARVGMGSLAVLAGDPTLRGRAGPASEPTPEDGKSASAQRGCPGPGRSADNPTPAAA
jgi:hypothetical protein